MCSDQYCCCCCGCKRSRSDSEDRGLNETKDTKQNNRKKAPITKQSQVPHGGKRSRSGSEDNGLNVKKDAKQNNNQKVPNETIIPAKAIIRKEKQCIQTTVDRKKAPITKQSQVPQFGDYQPKGCGSSSQNEKDVKELERSIQKPKEKENQGPPKFIFDAIVDPTSVMTWTKTNKIDNYESISRETPVYVVFDQNHQQRKLKGIVKRTGMMNKIPVFVVKLNEEFKYASNGVFGSVSVYERQNKKVVAVKPENIEKRDPYEPKEIPHDIVKFPELKLQSSAKCYSEEEKKWKYYGTIKWIGANEKDEYFYGIELDNFQTWGTDGTFRNQKLFKCQNGFGCLMPLLCVMPDTRFANITLKDSDIPSTEVCTSIRLAIPATTFTGTKIGIQGNQNSCYFDSTIFALFAKSDVLDFLISPKLNAIETCKVTKDFRDILSMNVIYPLRRFGFVSFHHMQSVRKIIRQYGKKFEEMTESETDMENMSDVLSRLCQNDPLIRLVSFNDVHRRIMFMQLFITHSEVRCMSTQNMLNLSMIQNEIMFETIPTCVILQAARDASDYRCYNFVIPLSNIAITPLVRHTFKKCCSKHCHRPVSFVCLSCSESNTYDISQGFLCERHKKRHSEEHNIKEISLSSVSSKNSVQLSLKAIICIEKCHFVSYVKQDDISNKWFFFDSMSTQGINDNYPVPSVHFDKDVSDFLNLQDHEKLTHVLCHNVDNIRRIVKDAYVFVYHNHAMTCY